MKQNEYCIYEADHKTKIATITFNHPAVLNAADGKDHMEIREKVIRAEEDDDISVIIFKGAGRCFGTGMRVDKLGPHHGWGPTGKEIRPSQRVRLQYDNHVGFGKRGLHQTIQNCCKATISQIHGYCYGAHLAIAMASDLAIASEDALFTHPGYRYIGAIWGIAYQMQLMGIRAAKEMMLTGRAFSAEEAAKCGLINRMVPLERLEEEVNKIATTIALMPRDAIVMGKSNMELAQDILGTSTSYTAGWTTHVLQTNIRYEPDEFNLFKAKRDKGVSGAIREREKHFGISPIAQRAEPTRG